MKCRRLSIILSFALALALGLAACGGNDSSGSAQTGSAASEAGSGAAQESGTGASSPKRGAQAGGAGGGGSGRSVPAGSGASGGAHHDSHAGPARYRTQGGDNSIVESGGEAADSEFAQAAGALHAYLDARVAQDWGAACGQLAKDFAREMVEQLGGTNRYSKAKCAEVLAGLNAGAPTAVRAQEAEVDVDALRVHGDSGFLLFSESSGQRLFIPVRRENGAWALAAIAPSAIS